MYYATVPLKVKPLETGTAQVLVNPLMAVLVCLALAGCVHRFPEPMTTRAAIHDAKGGCTYTTSNRIVLDQLAAYLFEDTEWRQPILPWFEVPFERIVFWAGTNVVASIDAGSNYMWTEKYRCRLDEKHPATMKHIKDQMSLDWNIKEKPAKSGDALPLDYMNPKNLTFPLEEAEFLLNP